MNNQWIEWSGGECPVDGFRYVLIKCRNGIEVEVKAGTPGIWRHIGSDGEIVAYKLLPQDPHKEWVKIESGCPMPGEGEEIVLYSKSSGQDMAEMIIEYGVKKARINRGGLPFMLKGSSKTHWRYSHPDPEDV